MTRFALLVFLAGTAAAVAQSPPPGPGMPPGPPPGVPGSVRPGPGGPPDAPQVEPASPQRLTVYRTAPPQLSQLVRPGVTVENLVEVALRGFDRFDVNQDGVLDTFDREAAERVRLMQARAQKVQFVLSHDLDGDGRVTRAEVETVVGRAGDAASRAAQVEAVMRNDLNRDGVVDYEEMRKLSPVELSGVPPEFVGDIVVWSGTGGKVTRAAFEAKVRELFTAVHPGSGRVTQDDLAAFRPPGTAPGFPPPSADRPPPPPPGDARARPVDGAPPPPPPGRQPGR